MTGQNSELLSRVRRRLEQENMRYTKARRLVVDALRTAPGPQSAAELVRRLGGAIPLSSLYRTLTLFEETGIVERFHDAAGVARYELAEWLTGHHHHLTCMVCGSTEDVPLPEDLEASIGRVGSAAGAESGFRVDGHRLELQGVCRTCR